MLNCFLCGKPVKLCLTSNFLQASNRSFEKRLRFFCLQTPRFLQAVGWSKPDWEFWEYWEYWGWACVGLQTPCADCFLRRTK